MKLIRVFMGLAVFFTGTLPAQASRAVRATGASTGALSRPAAISLTAGVDAPAAALPAPSLSLSGVLPTLAPVSLAAADSVSAAPIAARAPIVAPAPKAAAPRTPQAVKSPRKALGKRIRTLQGRLEAVNSASPEQGGSAQRGGDSSALLSSLFDQTFAENPESLAELELGLSRAPFSGAIAPGIDARSLLKNTFVRGFGSFFDAGAADVSERGRVNRLKAWNGEEAKSARRDLAVMLAQGSSLRSETWTYLFRDNEVWEQDFRRYLTSRIALKSRAGKRALRLDSVGAAYGAEPYTLAIIVEDELQRAGENPEEWDVRIRAFDKSFLSLVSISLGYYTNPEGGAYKIPSGASIRLRAESRRGRLAPTAHPSVHQLDERLLRWIEPVYIDLNDSTQHGVLRQSADVVFANYVLTHLRLRPAGDLAHWWLRGGWSDLGFLSMAQTLTALVSSSGRLLGEGRPIGRNRSFLSRFAATVGAIGGMQAGDRFEATARWRDRLFAHPTKVGKEVFRARDAFLRRLKEDPFFYATIEPEMLALVERLTEETGVHPVLTADQALVGRDAETGDFAINIGWLLRTGQPSEERAPLLERLWRAQAPSEGTAPRGPPSGATGQGAQLEIATIDGKPRLRWLSRDTLDPLSDAYSEDDALRRTVPGITVRF